MPTDGRGLAARVAVGTRCAMAHPPAGRPLGRFARPHIGTALAGENVGLGRDPAALPPGTVSPSPAQPLCVELATWPGARRTRRAILRLRTGRFTLFGATFQN